MLARRAAEKSSGLLAKLLDHDDDAENTASETIPASDTAEAIGDAERYSRRKGGHDASSSRPIELHSTALSGAAKEGWTRRAQETATPKIEARQLELTSEEKDFMVSLGRLFSTPRSAKRFVNSYRLLRAVVEVGNLDAFIGTKDAAGPYRAAVLMLAIAVQYPDGAKAFAHATSGESVTAFIRGRGMGLGERPLPVQGKERDEFLTLSRMLGEIPGLDNVSATDCRDWLLRVERFVFRG